jgi:prevent-host-death family protein
LARQKFSELIGRVYYGGETVILESSGKPMAAVIPFETYQKMMEAREARFARLHEIVVERQPVPYSEEEVEADVAKAIAAVRRKNATGGT